ncbi:hypothetical protein BC826DRAFT_158688 [Russula brevipes]|nr:hypothetical protein BC826DRAFT_158688 [Russula brevipes]
MSATHELIDSILFHLIEKTHQGWKEALNPSTSDPGTKAILRSSDIHTPSSVIPSHSHLSTTIQPRFRLRLGLRQCPHYSVLPRPVLPPSKSTSGVKFLGLPARSRASPRDRFDRWWAFKDCKNADAFDRPGWADLTTSVDLVYLAEAVVVREPMRHPAFRR